MKDSPRILRLCLAAAFVVLVLCAGAPARPQAPPHSGPVLFEYRAPGQTTGLVGEILVDDQQVLPFRKDDGTETTIPLAKILTLTLTQSHGRQWCYPKPLNAEDSDAEDALPEYALTSSNALIETSDHKQIRGCVSSYINIPFVPPQKADEQTPPFKLKPNEKASQTDDGIQVLLVRNCLGTFRRLQ